LAGQQIVHAEALVFILRNAKGKIVDRSLQRFYSEEELTTFWRAAEKALPNVEVHKILLRGAHEHPRDESKPQPRGTLWCPYCTSYRKFIEDEGYKRCEICQMSTMDFYIVKFNPDLAAQQKIDRYKPSKREK